MDEFFILRSSAGTFDLVGPVKLEGLIEQVKVNKLSWMDLAYAPETPERWTRLADLPELRGSLAKWPSRNFLATAEQKIKLNQPGVPVTQSQPPTTAPASLGPWFLQFDGGEFGPFSPNELTKLVSERKLQGQLFAWQKGLSNWIPVNTNDEIEKFLKNPAEIAAKYRQDTNPNGQNERDKNRRPLVATVRLATNQQIVGILLDISSSGMQLFADSRYTLEIDHTYDMEVLPATMSKLRSIRVKAKLTWIKENRIGLKFLEISEKDQKTIDSYTTQ